VLVDGLDLPLLHLMRYRHDALPSPRDCVQWLGVSRVNFCGVANVVNARHLFGLVHQASSVRKKFFAQPYHAIMLD
jgi:hypothetical protein